MMGKGEVPARAARSDGPRRTPTQRDVADRAGVSTATVSYVLSGRSNRSSPVPDQTRARVLAAVDELGYRLNHAGRRLRRRRTELVALVYEPPSSPWLDPVADYAEDLADRHGYAVIHLPVRNASTAERVTAMLADGIVDGALMIASRHFSADTIARLAGGGLAVVSFHESWKPNGFDVVRHGELAATASATQYLIDQGRRRIAFMGVAGVASRRNPRVAGYRKALEAAAIEVDERLVVRTDGFRDSMYRAALEVFRSERPDAVLSSTDRGAIAALWAAREVGLSVPEDVAVIGMGNTAEGEMVRPRLTSLGVSDRRHSLAIQRLFDRIGDGTLPGLEISQPWALARRESA